MMFVLERYVLVSMCMFGGLCVQSIICKDMMKTILSHVIVLLHA